MDNELLSRFINQKVELINDEHFVMTGRITAVHDSFLEFFTGGKTRILSFDRIREIRPLRGNNAR